ncbi:hypothetical protein [Candidatus Weimeria sp. HCP3S3_B5]|jgi:hypothetical protein|uniref:hypothetical protein n=1 Tax=Candidatus Weimeria sp. HCP3S3_B5 TaxID=3438871 RepID=UPI002A9B6D3B|nr:hypothetical protein [Lachnospiraceae bacterium]MDY6352497.1 hypothetical protein [Lachnospiraceae bacterium]
MTDKRKSRLARFKARAGKSLAAILVASGITALIVGGLYQGLTRSRDLIYKDHLDDTAAVVDGEKLTFRDLAFYVTYEENQVQKSALAYDPEKPWDYWDSNLGGKFVVSEAKRASINMAIHDRILLRMAEDSGTALTTEEKKQLENRTTDFYEDLYDDQRENLPVSYQTINRTISDIAIAEKYQRELAEKNDDTFASYSFDGKAYKRLRKKHDVKISDSWWRIRMGRITLGYGVAYSSSRKNLKRKTGK